MVLSTAFSIRGSFSPVWRLVRRVDLNSVWKFSPPAMRRRMLSFSCSSIPMVSAFPRRKSSMVRWKKALLRLA